MRVVIRAIFLSAIFLLMSNVRVGAQSSDNETILSVGDGTLRRIRVPVLMYHYVSPIPENADDIRIGLTIEPDIFRQHIQYLHDNGYTTISLEDLDAALRMGMPLPPKPVVLTFDDGYIDHYINVFPILQEFNFSGTFFVITGRADSDDPAYMRWEHIVEMSRAGMHIEPHTKSHLDLRERDYDFLIYELLGSYESVEAHTGVAPTAFAYPGGRYDDATLSVLETLPISRAVTTQYGALHTTDNTLEVSRIRVDHGTGVPGLAWLLENA
ncbi:MAG: polysaccharide deacetylase family protein [Chloroflexi bacterium]|nr:MAG: polysaccharide deacetylase family protein [Chloroflexota bacterium]